MTTPTSPEQDPQTQAAINTAQALMQFGLSEQFARLASRTASKAERRAVAEFVAQLFVPLGVALQAKAFGKDECTQLERGLWNAALAAPANSKTEGLNIVLWERALSNLYSYDEKAAVAALRYGAMDQKLKKRSVPAKRLAANLNFTGKMWHPQNWGNTPATATNSFNRTAKWITQKLHPASRYVGDLQQRRDELAAWRRAQTAAVS